MPRFTDGKYKISVKILESIHTDVPELAFNFIFHIDLVRFTVFLLPKMKFSKSAFFHKFFFQFLFKFPFFFSYVVLSVGKSAV